jgi:hypothetical protein
MQGSPKEQFPCEHAVAKMQTCGSFLRKKPFEFIDFHCSNPEAARESGAGADRDFEVALQSTRRFRRGARRLLPGLLQALPGTGSQNRDGAAKGGNLGSILSDFGALSGQKRPKTGQKRGFTVTSQLTMNFCI